MDAGIGLTPEQLAALVPGDVVTIESGAELGRTRHMSGIVTRATDISAFVTTQSARGIAYVQEFSLRTGWRAGRGGYGALVSAAPPTLGADEGERRQLQRIDGVRRA